MKTYSAGSTEVELTIERVRKQFYRCKQRDVFDAESLENVTIGALFVFDIEDSSKQALQHGGYPAAAMIRITPLRERALGVADAVIIIDRAVWLSMKTDQCDALIDHELHHLVRDIDEDTMRPKTDAVDRPKLLMRKHDRQFGWFDAVADRHGENSMEVRQARSLLAETSQLYFDFGNLPQAVDTARDLQTLKQLGVVMSGTLKDGTKFEARLADEDPADELLPSAIEFVQRTGKARVSSVQNQLKIGYNRAARIMEAMEKLGIVGPLPATGEREILKPAAAH